LFLSVCYFIPFRTKNSSHTSITSANKPELCVDLNGATIEWASVKSSRKGVFQVTTLLGLQLLLQDEDETNAVVWFNQIRRAIQRLPCGSRGSS
jgi:Rho GTPase-activating protein 15